MDDFDTRQISRKRLALATALGRGNAFFIGIVDHSQQLPAWNMGFMERIQSFLHSPHSSVGPSL
nr:hypothetical protein [Pseudomonas sp. NBRC 111119]